LDWGAVTSAVHEDDPSKIYHTAYIYADKRYLILAQVGIHHILTHPRGRAQGVFTNWIKAHTDYTIVTTPDCELEAFLAKHGVPYVVALKPQFPEYEMVERYYGNKVTRRSGG
jgi:hypothetical protein